MKKYDAYAWLEALNQESKEKFSIYQESGIFTLRIERRKEWISTICTGMTEKECYKAIEALRGYFRVKSKSFYPW